MPLTYRALLVPTSAIDSSGNAKPNTTFEVRSLGTDTPVAVYDAASGGVALSSSAIKSDVRGNIAGFYVDEPGPYSLVFSNTTVITAAIRDDRDIPSELTVGTPMYSHDADTGAWTVQPGQNPGSARFASKTLYSTDTPGTVNGFYEALIPFQTTVENAEVATLVDTNRWQFAAPGLYLVSVLVTMYPVNNSVDPEEFIQFEVSPGGATQQWFGVSPAVMTDIGSIYGSVSFAALATDNAAFNGRVLLRTKTYVWQGQAEVTIVRLD